MNVDNIIIKLQDVGLKITSSRLKIGRWADVKHIDGHTYGYIVNIEKNICTWIRRGTTIKGTFKIDDNAKLIPNFKFRQQIREQKRAEDKSYFIMSQKLSKQYFSIEDIGNTCKYLTSKKVDKYACKTDCYGNLVIPIRKLVQDKSGKINAYIRTLQTISPDGVKRLSFGGQKQDGMHMLNFPLRLLPKPDNQENMNKFAGRIIIAEGYATAATIAKLTTDLCVMSVDAGNMLSVVKQIRLAYPNSKIVIAADNDLKLSELHKGSHKWIWGNTGVESALNCQNEVGCMVAVPPVGMDWNDCFMHDGIVATAQLFFQQIL